MHVVQVFLTKLQEKKIRYRNIQISSVNSTLTAALITSINKSGRQTAGTLQTFAI